MVRNFASFGFVITITTTLLSINVSGSALAEEAIYTNRKPPVLNEKTPPSPSQTYPVKDCKAEVQQKIQEQTARYGSPPGEESVTFFRKECEDETAQYQKMNEENVKFHKEQLAAFEADQAKERERVKEYQTLFYAEEKAAKTVADTLLKTPGVSFNPSDIADIRLLKDNAHLLKGKTFITEAQLLERTSPTTAIFQTAGYTTVQVKNIPADQILVSSEYVVLVGTISGLEIYQNKTSDSKYELPTIEWKASPACRVSLPDGLESHSAQCLPMAVIRKELKI